MSVEAISHIMRTHIPDGVAKLVAMVLADYADPVTGRCWPKIPTLAAQCSQSERTVQRKLKVLEDLEVLHVEPNLSGDRKGNMYVLHLPGAAAAGPNSRRRRTGDTAGAGAATFSTGDTQSPVPDATRVTHGHPTGDSADTRRVTLLSPPIENPPENPPSEESPRTPLGGARSNPDRMIQEGASGSGSLESGSARQPRAARGCRGPAPPEPELDAAALGRFERLWAAYPVGGRLTAQRGEAITGFASLTPDEQELAIRTAAAYAATCAETRGQAKALHRWLRIGRWQNGAVATPPAAAGPGAPPSRVFVREGSPEWEAWAAHYRRLGKPMMTPIQIGGQDGWRFESALPPGATAAA